jgi:uncharacterized protein (TIGR02145 family)
MSKTVSKLAFTAGFVLAVAFVFSCTGDDNLPCLSCDEGDSSSSYGGGGGLPSSSSGGDGDNPSSSSVGGGGSSSSGGGQGDVSSSSGGDDDNSSSSSVDGESSSSSGGDNPSSSSVDGESSSSSSSSVVPSSSSSIGYAGTYGSLSYEGQTYKTVIIGTQTWMAENLNYSVAGSKCYNNEPENCIKYGRLYDWSTAMGFSSSCNSSTCSNLIQTKHRGICPSGWHIPSSKAEWNTLSNYVQSNSGCSNCAVRLLKATSSWYNNGNGTDNYGFSALPGGVGSSDGSFSDVGNIGYWWSANEDGNDVAYNQDMIYYFDFAYGAYNSKDHLFSVRCLQD